MDSPAADPSAFVRASRGADGKSYLTWIESQGELARLKFASYQGKQWSASRLIAQGSNWFVNWADLPTMSALADGTLAACWLERLGEGTYAYGIRMVWSKDAGETWSDPQWLHDDRQPTEHGFVSLAALDDSRFLATWLDGNSLEKSGNMQLRSTWFDTDGGRGDEVVVDPRVCECCATSLVVGEEETVVAYRDRSQDEIRDIYFSRRSANGWSKVRACHDDGWKMPG